MAEKDYKTNVLVVSKDEKELGKKEAQITSMNWLSAVLPVESQKVEVKIRYRTPSVSANLELASPNIPNSPSAPSPPANSPSSTRANNSLVGE